MVGTEGTEDVIPTNRRLKTVNLPGRVAFMSQPRSRGQSPRTDHKDGSRESLCFDVHIEDMENLAMHGIRLELVEVMREWLVVKLSCVVRLSANKWCELWVRVQNFHGKIVHCRIWQYFCRCHMIVRDDLLVVWIFGLGMKGHIYNHDSLIMCRMRSTTHNCIGDISLVI